MKIAHAWLFAVSCLTLLAVGSATAEDAKISFKKARLASVFHSEGVAVGDFNKDGKPDIAAGSVWFEAPDWKQHSILEKPKSFDPHGYSDTFCNFSDDVNGDGWADLIVVDFPGKQTWWFENPKNADGPWARHEATPVTNNESPTYLDVDGDGKRELLMGVSPDPKNPDSNDRQMAIIRRGADVKQPWTIQAISAKGAPGTRKFEHGLGLGDMNKDGRADIVVPQGWWEAPMEKSAKEWTFHAAPLGAACAQMYIYDYDGDGDSDVLSSSAHGRGIWWHEHTPDGWKTHEIDKSFSQTHALCLADINGDGLMDFITGKRYWAHGPKGDDGADQPAVMFWFELTRTKDGPKWIPHQFDHDSGVGTQFEVADVNGDGMLDVITSNKQGVYYFQQERK